MFSNIPSSYFPRSVVSYDVSSREVVLLSDSGPRLSHHAGVMVSSSDSLVVVGGWDGRHRSHEVHKFNLEDNE